MRIRTRAAAPALVATLALAALPAAGAEMTAEQWRSDLAFVADTIRATHPNPFARTSQGEFEDAVRSLHHDIPELGRHQIVARLMELLALLQDGHTRLQPSGEMGFNTWFPVRFYPLTDGIFVTVSDRQQPGLVGARVVEIGGRPADRALARAEELVSGDNALWKLANAPLYLSNGDALFALGVLESPESLPLVVETATGERRELALAGRPGAFGTGWFWRALGPPPGCEAVRPFEPDDAPLHLLHQFAPTKVYDFRYLEEARTLYFQLNIWRDDPNDPLAEFNRRLWDFYDSHDVDRFVFDLRYNGGGDGSLFREILREIVRRPELEEPGRLVVLVGRRTFSASVNALGDLLAISRATLVGEPMGSGFNLYGDAMSFQLPESGLTLWVSSLYWQNGFPGDHRSLVSPHLPALFSSADFFGGRDPALELVLSGEALGVPDRFVRDGADSALAFHRRLSGSPTTADWWRPFGARELVDLGYDLLHGGRGADAQAAFLLGTELFPQEWNGWDSLGEAYLANGQLEEAAAAYRRSVELNPGNHNGLHQLNHIASLAGEGSFVHPEPATCPADCGEWHTRETDHPIRCPVCGMPFRRAN